MGTFRSSSDSLHYFKSVDFARSEKLYCSQTMQPTLLESPQGTITFTTKLMKLFNKKENEKPKHKEDKPVEKRVEISAGPSPEGGDGHSYGVVLSPHITEKGTLMGEQSKYVFKITRNANKTEIKKAIRSLYKVEVAKVHISYARPKLRKVGKSEGRKPGFKKAIVTLKEGSKIDLAQ